ncbi:unnamed protein product [Fraxinus pennsylvanica]|uniref:Calcium-dependent protein kinase n=1 Tax=Fraxinus pennsylvanica TaxID=56036 RepID=A0AAD2DY06_9LAMI|nr:unnamed protein product [Fraxinus pennsylvanica]
MNFWVWCEKFSEIVGSPYYITPEILKRNYGPEVDVWSADVILYILLCGVPPFWVETEQGVALTILRGVIDFKREPWPQVSESAKSLVRQMLEPDPKKRLTAQQIVPINIAKLLMQLVELIAYANAVSGMAVHDDCKLKFLELKAKRNYRFLVFKIEAQQVVVEKLGSPIESYGDFTDSLPPNECHYVVFDFDFTTDENV